MRRRRALLITLAILVVLPLTGALSQTLCVRGESRRYPPPGMLINVGGPGEPARRLHLVCLGQGEPTVSSSAARTEISGHMRVCSYDRTGMGWSDLGPGLISAGMLAEDLQRLTIQAGLRPPFILAPASMGGLIAELFTARHPDRVAGLVFLDALNGAAAQSIAAVYRVEPAATFCGLARGLETTTREIAGDPPLPPDLPLVVLVHDRPDSLLPPGFAAETAAVERDWLPLQQRFTRRSSRGTWRVVAGSDHLIGRSQPHAVAAAVIDMVTEIRRTR